MSNVERNAQTTVSFDEGSAASRALRERTREQLDADIAAFLSRGGQITQVDPNVRADPPRKPDINYGVAPI